MDPVSVGLERWNRLASIEAPSQDQADWNDIMFQLILNHIGKEFRFKEWRKLDRMPQVEVWSSHFHAIFENFKLGWIIVDIVTFKLATWLWQLAQRFFFAQLKPFFKKGATRCPALDRTPAQRLCLVKRAYWDAITSSIVLRTPQSVGGIIKKSS